MYFSNPNNGGVKDILYIDGCLSTTPRDEKIGAERFHKRPLQLKSSGQAP